MTQESIAKELEELAVRFSEGWHEGIKIDASDIMLLNEVAQALAQPEQEPVATVTSETGADITMSWWHEPALPIGTKLYIAPPQRKPLTDDEIFVIKHNWITTPFTNHLDFARAIEAAHGIKE